MYYLINPNKNFFFVDIYLIIIFENHNFFREKKIHQH